MADKIKYVLELYGNGEMVAQVESPTPFMLPLVGERLHFNGYENENHLEDPGPNLLVIQREFMIVVGGGMQHHMVQLYGITAPKEGETKQAFQCTTSITQQPQNEAGCKTGCEASTGSGTT